MTTAREVVAQALYTKHWELLKQGVTMDAYPMADAALAALRKHWTSDETITRLTFSGFPWGRHVVAALFEDTPRG